MGQKQKRIRQKERRLGRRIRGDIAKWDQTDSPEILDRGETLESPASLQRLFIRTFRPPHNPSQYVQPWTPQPKQQSILFFIRPATKALKQSLHQVIKQSILFIRSSFKAFSSSGHQSKHSLHQASNQSILFIRPPTMYSLQQATNQGILVIRPSTKWAKHFLYQSNQQSILFINQISKAFSLSIKSAKNSLYQQISLFIRPSRPTQDQLHDVHQALCNKYASTRQNNGSFDMLSHQQISLLKPPPGGHCWLSGKTLFTRDPHVWDRCALLAINSLKSTALHIYIHHWTSISHLSSNKLSAIARYLIFEIPRIDR